MEIDPDYFVLYNAAQSRYEVHHRRQRNTLALAVPYPSLDARTVQLAQKTRRENIEGLIAEMDAKNQRLEERADKAVFDNAKERFEEEIGRMAKHENK